MSTDVMEVQKMAPVYSLKFDKTVTYWNQEKGAGVMIDGTPDSRYWGIGMDLDTEIVPEPGEEGFSKALLQYLKNNLGYSSDYFAIMDDGRISFNMIENGDSEPVDTSNDINEQLYLADYSVQVDVVYKLVPSMGRLKELLPTAEF